VQDDFCRHSRASGGLEEGTRVCKEGEEEDRAKVVSVPGGEEASVCEVTA